MAIFPVAGTLERNTMLPVVASMMKAASVGEAGIILALRLMAPIPTAVRPMDPVPVVERSTFPAPVV
jgi:hypothetical protein